MKKENFNELTEAELQERLATEKGKLVSLKLQHSISPIDNPQLIKVARKNIARLETLLHKNVNK